MRTTLKLLTSVIAVTILSACQHQIVYRDRYSIMTPNDSLLQDYDVGAPPISAQTYAQLSNDEKESLWTQYTSDLLVVIKKHMADKAGLREAKKKSIEEVERLNKEAEKQNGN